MSGDRNRWLYGILILAALVRLVHLQAQPIGHHGWRQADTAAVARNFHQGGHRLLFPEIDWETPGYVEMEFPVYPWLVSLGYRVTGERIWVARAAAAAASLATILLLFQLVRRSSGEEEALWAALLLAVLPLSIYFGRAVMPESWMLAASVAGVSFFDRWLDRRSGPLFLSSALLIALACLLKPTSIYLGLPLLWLIRGPLKKSRRVRLQALGFAVLVAAPVALWYLHAYRLGAASGATFGILSGPSAKLGHWDLLLQPAFYNRLFLEFFGNRLLTWIGLGLFVLGLFLRRRSDRERLFDWWFAGAAIVLLLSGGGSYFHEYYALPLLVPGVVHAGRALAWIRARSLPLLLVLLVGLGSFSGFRWAGYLALEEDSPADNPRIADDLLAGRALAQYTSPGDLVLSCNQTNPTWLYLSRRKGWGRDCDAMDKRALQVLHELGARHLMARHRDFASPGGLLLHDHLLHTYRRLSDDGNLFLVDLEPLDPALRDWQVLWTDTFQDRQPPAGWELELGSWRTEDGRLTMEPARRESRVLVDPSFPACSVCAVRMTLRADEISDQTRRAILTLKGWWVEDSFTEAWLNFSSGRVSLRQSESGSVIAQASAELPLSPAENHALELAFDGFDFVLRLGSDPVLTLPSRAAPPPLAPLSVSARNLRLAVQELAVATPAPAPAPNRSPRAGGL